MPGCSSSCGASVRISFSISLASSRSSAELLDAPGDCSQGEHGAAQFGVVAPLGSGRCETAEESSSGERPQLAA